MNRDSLFGEAIIWAGRPKVLETPGPFRLAALVSFVLAAIGVAFAVAIATTLGMSPTGPLIFSAWTLAVGAACLHVPRLLLSRVHYVVTENHVICQSGPFRRSIERRSISFARIFWSKSNRAVGDIELVRAVPTGVFRRRLMLRLHGVAAPDRVWAIVRGVSTSVPGGLGERPLTQRLDDGERVIWSARPRPTWRAYVPQGRREISLLVLSLAMFAVLGAMLSRAVPNMRDMVAAGLATDSLAFGMLLVGQGLALVVLLAVGAWLFYDGGIRSAWLVRQTRFLITNRRVLIQRGREELHLDRPKIVDVIDTPKGDGLSDVFLVLDGPRARALAASGAFGESERGPHLRPVLEALEDSESVSRILAGPPSELPRAA